MENSTIMLQVIPAMRRTRSFEKRFTNFKEGSMSFLKLNGRICVTLAALAMLAASPQAARAETIFLKCGSWDVAAIDLTNRTVNNIPADITPVSIDWDKVSKGGGVH